MKDHLQSSIILKDQTVKKKKKITLNKGFCYLHTARFSFPVLGKTIDSSDPYIPALQIMKKGWDGMPTDVEESACIVVILHDLFTSGEIKALLKDIKEIKQSLIGGLATEKGFNYVKFERVECSNVCCWFMQKLYARG